MSKILVEKKDLVHGEYYFGDCRNADTARWDANRNKFYYWRNKFGQRFVEDINHFEDDNGFDLFYPEHVVDYGVNKIPLRDDFA